MSDLSGEVVAERLKQLHDAAHRQLGISDDIEPLMTLCFMSLIVIPELKISTCGLFDVTKFDFVPLEAE
jgi:adenine deaminase